MQRLNKQLHLCIDRGISYLLKTQKENGSWDGPLSSRIRETYLVYLLGKSFKQNYLEETSKKWLQIHQKEQGETELEILLNIAIINMYKGREINLSLNGFYLDTVIRKTLMIYSLGIANESSLLLPEQYSSPEVVLDLIDKFIENCKGNIKGWALAELLAVKIILCRKIGASIDKLVENVLSLNHKANNWFQNPATTAFVLIALQYADIEINFENYISFFIETMQTDGGWSYCGIPLWDTGLSIQTLNLYRPLSYEASQSRNRALGFVSRNQNKDGGWGFNVGLESEADTSSIILHSLKTLYQEEDIVATPFEVEASYSHGLRPAVFRKFLRPITKNVRVIRSAEKYFYKLQFQSGAYKGLWPVWRKSESPSPEVVGHIITALNSSESSIDISQAKKWLDKIIENGSWEADWGRNLTYSIHSILKANGASGNSEKLVEVLLRTQNKDGGWGAYDHKDSNASATANAISALKVYKETYYEQIGRGVQYLVSSQQENGSWPRVKEVIGPRPFTYADDSSTHNFAMQALLS